MLGVESFAALLMVDRDAGHSEAIAMDGDDIALGAASASDGLGRCQGPCRGACDDPVEVWCELGDSGSELN